MPAQPTNRDEPPSTGSDLSAKAPLTISEGEDVFAAERARAQRLVAAELEIAATTRRLLENNLAITEAQLELAERQLDQLIAENERLREENADLRCRLGGDHGEADSP
jgi:hypothetical protein